MGNPPPQTYSSGRLDQDGTHSELLPKDLRGGVGLAGAVVILCTGHAGRFMLGMTTVGATVCGSGWPGTDLRANDQSTKIRSPRRGRKAESGDS